MTDQTPEKDQAEIMGLPIVGMPDGITPLSALVVVKALDADGDVAYFVRATDGLLSVEAPGMTACAKAKLLGSLDEGDF